MPIMTTAQINTVYLETDLSKFKTIVGNRAVEEDRVKKIMKSIDEVGMIQAPIIVNDLMEVIDGQGRLEACRRLGLPVPYIVIEGIGIRECRAMNIYAKQWTLLDFVKSHMNAGNQNYKRFYDFHLETGFPLAVSIYLAKRSRFERCSKEIREGTFVFTEEDAQESRELNKFVHRFDDIETNRITTFVYSLVYCYFDEEVDNELLEKKIRQSPRAFGAISNMDDCIQVMENVYNKWNHHPIYLYTNYRKYVQSKVGTYGLRLKQGSKMRG